ncbi:MAG: hypothetical protein ACD_22C00180G0007 [uncultured bacterium]|nr:MAG: hypothetical protein ACD_22C00180G0007 [uncultured bacterium]
MAAGFTILQNNIQLLEQRLVEFTKNLAEELFEPILEIDLKIPITEVNTQLSAELTKLKPFGVGNREPVFLTENLGIASMNIVGREKTHLSFRFYAGGMYFGCIMFNKAELASEFKPGDMVDVVYKIKESQYNGNKKLDLIIEDIRKNKSSC